jgi:hypothetical protein
MDEVGTYILMDILNFKENAASLLDRVYEITDETIDKNIEKQKSM